MNKWFGKIRIVLSIAFLAGCAAAIPLFVYGDAPFQSLYWETTVHSRFMLGVIPFPFQHRVLTFYILQIFLDLGISFGNATLLIRYLSAGILFSGLYLLYKDHINKWLLLTIAYGTLSIPILCSNMSSVLTGNTIIDIGLMAMMLYFYKKEEYLAIIPIVLIGVFNRETIIVLPTILFFDYLINKKRTSKGIVSLVVAQGLGIMLYTILAFQLPGRNRAIPYDKFQPGIEALVENLRLENLIYTLATFSLLPIISFINFKHWKNKFLNVAIVLVFTMLALCYGTTVEPRLMLYSILLVFIPTAIRMGHYGIKTSIT